MDELTPQELAAYDCVDQLKPHADALHYGALLWNGWALRYAFAMGAAWQREQDAAAHALSGTSKPGA